MSALDSLPAWLQSSIAAQDPERTRDDLLAIPAAEAAGWKVSFRDGSWHNSAEFERDGVHVWYIVGRYVGWRRARVIDGRFEPLDYATQCHPTLAEALA